MNLIKIYAGVLALLTVIEIVSVFFASEANTGLTQDEIENHAKNLRRSTLMIAPLILRCLEII